MALDLDLDRRVEPDGDRVRAARVEDAPAARRRVADGVEAAFSSRSGVTARSNSAASSRSSTLIRRAARSQRRPARARAPTTRALGAGQHGDRAVLGRHRDPVVGLGHHGRLARDRVAQHREAVGRADRERVEAVEVLEAALERLLERRALAQPPRQVAGGHLGVVVGLELDALAAQPRRRRLWFESEPLWTRQRSSPVENGCECSVVTRLSVAIRVWPSAWRARHVGERERRDELARRARLLVDLDRLARAHHAQLGWCSRSQACAPRRSVSTTITAWLARGSGSPAPNALAERGAHRAPVRCGRGVNSETLDEPSARGRGRRDAGAVGAAVAQLDEHARRDARRGCSLTRSTW